MIKAIDAVYENGVLRRPKQYGVGSERVRVRFPHWPNETWNTKVQQVDHLAKRTHRHVFSGRHRS